MTWDEAIEAIENGDARMLIVQAVILKTKGKIYLTFNGEEWEETDSDMIRRGMEE